MGCKFKEITVEPGKEINLLLQHEDKLIEFLKRVKSSVTTDLYKHLYPELLTRHYVRAI